MSKKVRVILNVMVVLLTTLIILLVLDMRQDSLPYGEDNTSMVYEDNSVNLDEKVEAYLSTTEVSGQISVNAIGSINVADVFDYPLMYSADIAYYTQHDCYDNPSKEGAIFLDARITDYENRVLLIHGLTTESNSMFSELENYLDDAWASEHSELVLNLNGNKVYQLSSVIVLEEQEPIIQLDCNSNSVYTKFFETLNAQATKTYECEFSCDKQLVILNTVTLDGRYVLVCFLEVL